MKSRTNPLIVIILTLLSLACLMPFWLVLMVSMSKETELTKHGYKFWPNEFDFTAYHYLMEDLERIARAYGVTIFVTVVGTIVSLLVTSSLAFTLSRSEFPYRKFLTFYVFFTMLFSGGLLPWYLVYTRLLHVQDTLLALIIPLLIGGFNVFIMRTFFTNSIPPSIVESAKIDGASEYRIYFGMILPLSLPVLATVGLFMIVRYWNDWFTSMVFIQNENLYPLQYLLTRTLLNMQFLQSLAASGEVQSDIQVAQPIEALRMAMAMIVIGPLMFVFPFLQKYFIKGLTVGAVKG